MDSATLYARLLAQPSKPTGFVPAFSTLTTLTNFMHARGKQLPSAASKVPLLAH